MPPTLWSVGCFLFLLFSLCLLKFGCFRTARVSYSRWTSGLGAVCSWNHAPKAATTSATCEILVRLRPVWLSCLKTWIAKLSSERRILCCAGRVGKHFHFLQRQLQSGLVVCRVVLRKGSFEDATISRQDIAMMLDQFLHRGGQRQASAQPLQDQQSEHPLHQMAVKKSISTAGANLVPKCSLPPVRIRKKLK